MSLRFKTHRRSRLTVSWLTSVGGQVKGSQKSSNQHSVRGRTDGRTARNPAGQLGVVADGNAYKTIRRPRVYNCWT